MSSKEDLKKRWFTDAKPMTPVIASTSAFNTRSANSSVTTNVKANPSSFSSSAFTNKIEQSTNNSSLWQKSTSTSITTSANRNTGFSSIFSTNLSGSQQKSSSASSTTENKNFVSSLSNGFSNLAKPSSINKDNSLFSTSPPVSYISPYRNSSSISGLGVYNKANSANNKLLRPIVASAYRKTSESSTALKPTASLLAASAALATKGNSYAKSYTATTPVFAKAVTDPPKVVIEPPKNELRTKPKKGYAIILNHEQFKNKEMNREGSRRDEEALSRMFTHFGFTLTVKRNKKFSEIQSFVKECRKNFKDYGCLVAVILSHGTNDETIYAYDEPFNLNYHFIHPISTNSSLIGKPKIFIIATCRGSLKDVFTKQVSMEMDSVPFTEKSNSLPCYRDILRCYSTYEGFVSYRDPSKGTIYIQTLCNILLKNGATTSIEDILKQVNKELTEGDYQNKQVPTVVSTMSTHFCFGELKQK